MIPTHRALLPSIPLITKYVYDMNVVVIRAKKTPQKRPGIKLVSFLEMIDARYPFSHHTFLCLSFCKRALYIWDK